MVLIGSCDDDDGRSTETFFDRTTNQNRLTLGREAELVEQQALVE